MVRYRESLQVGINIMKPNFNKYALRYLVKVQTSTEACKVHPLAFLGLIVNQVSSVLSFHVIYSTLFSLQFFLEGCDMTECTVMVYILEMDSHGKHRSLGGIEVPLSTVNLNSNDFCCCQLMHDIAF